VNKRGHIARIITITPAEASPQFGDADFSPQAIGKRDKQGHAAALKSLSTALGPVLSTER
jgi:hypothetical protein